MSASDAFFRIRASRAEPPGLAAGEEERRRTYGAALDQFEELMAAASGATAPSRPLPLFYALSQAGRAIAAARADGEWRLRGHGLSVPELGVSNACDLLVHPVPSRGKGGRVDSFGAITALSGSEPMPAPVSLGALWASLPGACDYLPDDRWLRPLHVVPREPGIQPAFDCARLSADLIGIRGRTQEEARAELGDYPLAAGADLPTVQNVFLSRELTPFGPGVLIRWPSGATDVWGWQLARDRILPLDPPTGRRWLRPALAGADLGTLPAWWALLFGLSMLARYEPGAWVAALDLDRPGLAAQLTMLLDLALEAVPALVASALAPPARHQEG
ncbi:MAG: hypothetical protein WB507_00480 [Solirubrobacterales bacterium]